MDKKLLERVADIHSRAFTVDAHFDLTYEVANLRERGGKKIIEEKYLPQIKAGGFDLLVSAIFIDSFFLPEMGLRRALDQISFLHAEGDESPGQFCLCRTTAEALAAKRAGQTAIFLSLEGAEPLQNDIQLLRIFYELGVRGLGLVWSRRNYVADGAFFSPVSEGCKGGLTPFGVELIQQAENLGMFIDVSHINDEGFWDVMDVADKPVIASHSNCRSLAGTMRNLTDDQIRAIAKNNGVIGMNSVDVFIHDQSGDANINHFVDHVDHIVNIVGINHVGLGLDLCDGFQNFLQLPEAIETQDVIKTHAGIGEFTAELVVRGYTDADIIAILGGNFMRYYSELLG
ncbi:dipeptidase [uncultured Desulfuromusa sp.]|uniref:dipeptidase n=1 Tax=uncultured Desulfuromusa sp. TaxID=219183 RepID=UPI002AA85383|nr:dipeptidase [uncultured Desulfuromusa sp.]